MPTLSIPKLVMPRVVIETLLSSRWYILYETFVMCADSITLGCYTVLRCDSNEITISAKCSSMQVKQRLPDV